MVVTLGTGENPDTQQPKRKEDSQEAITEGLMFLLQGNRTLEE